MIDTNFILQQSKGALELAALWGLEGDERLQAAAIATKKITGTNPLELFKQSPYGLKEVHKEVEPQTDADLSEMLPPSLFYWRIANIIGFENIALFGKIRGITTVKRYSIVTLVATELEYLILNHRSRSILYETKRNTDRICFGYYRDSKFIQTGKLSGYAFALSSLLVPEFVAYIIEYNESQKK